MGKEQPVVGNETLAAAIKTSLGNADRTGALGEVRYSGLLTALAVAPTSE